VRVTGIKVSSFFRIIKGDEMIPHRIGIELSDKIRLRGCWRVTFGGT